MLGFYPISSAKITFGRDGNWYADGEPIVNRRIADLFSRQLRRDADGRYVIRMADEWAPVEIEDTPYVVRSADVDAGGVTLHLNDLSTEKLDPSTLRVGSGEVLYCRVKNGAEPARFLRPAYYQLSPYLDEAAPGRFVLRLPSGTHEIRRDR